MIIQVNGNNYRGNNSDQEEIVETSLKGKTLLL